MAVTTGTQTLLSQVDQGVATSVEELFRSAARRVRTRLVNRSSVDIPVRVGTADICRLGQALDRVQEQEGGAFVRFKLMPGDLSGLLVVEGALLFRLTGLMLGEDPWGEPPLYRWRALTAVDLSIARRITEDVLGGISDACPPQLGAFSTIHKVSASPRISFPLARSTMVVEVGLDFGPPNEPFGMISMILPTELAAVLAPERLEAQTRRATMGKGVGRVMPVEVEAVAEFGRVKSTLQDVSKLKVGSVLDLGAVGDGVLRVGGRGAFSVDVGERNGVRSVRVRNRLGEE